MGKEEFVSILSRKGYISKIENGVVIVYAHNISNDKEMKAFLTEVKNLVKETGSGRRWNGGNSRRRIWSVELYLRKGWYGNGIHIVGNHVYLPWYIYGCAYDECSKKM